MSRKGESSHEDAVAALPDRDLPSAVVRRLLRGDPEAAGRRSGPGSAGLLPERGGAGFLRGLRFGRCLRRRPRRRRGRTAGAVARVAFFASPPNAAEPIRIGEAATPIPLDSVPEPLRRFVHLPAGWELYSVRWYVGARQPHGGTPIASGTYLRLFATATDPAGNEAGTADSVNVLVYRGGSPIPAPAPTSSSCRKPGWRIRSSGSTRRRPRTRSGPTMRSPCAGTSTETRRTAGTSTGARTRGPTRSSRGVSRRWGST